MQLIMDIEIYLDMLESYLEVREQISQKSQKLVYDKRITKEMLQRQFLRYKITRSLGNELSENKIQETNLYANNHRCGSIPRYSQGPNWKLEVNVLDVNL